MRTRYDEVREQVMAFHKAHPKVWKLYCDFTFDRISKGFKHYSCTAIFERVRWETDQAIVGENEFKLNNNYRPFYARAFMKRYPDYEGFFRTRTQTTKDKPATGFPEITPDNVE